MESRLAVDVPQRRQEQEDARDLRVQLDAVNKEMREIEEIKGVRGAAMRGMEVRSRDYMRRFVEKNEMRLAELKQQKAEIEERVALVRPTPHNRMGYMMNNMKSRFWNVFTRRKSATPAPVEAQVSVQSGEMPPPTTVQ